MLTIERLTELLDRIPSLNIAVAGDFFLDRYLVVDPALAERSLETGLEARQVVEIRSSPGAAGTVTNNLAALGVGHIEAVGVIGDDGEGYELLRGLRATGVEVASLALVEGRFTPTYTKPMERTPEGERELERLDIKNRAPLPREAEESLLARLDDLAAGGVDAIVVADQVQERNCGVITDRVRDGLAALAARHPGLLLFADSRERIGEFRGVTIKPNEREAARALGLEPAGDLAPEQAGKLARDLMARTGRPVFLTLGARGILACASEGVEQEPAPAARGPIDIVGAGDSATAGIVCALCAGASPGEAAMVGNLCATVTIHKLGTTGTASRNEVIDQFPG